MVKISTKTAYYPCAAILGLFWFICFAHVPWVSEIFLGGNDPHMGTLNLNYYTLLTLMIADALLCALLLPAFWTRCSSWKRITLISLVIPLLGALVYCFFIHFSALAVSVVEQIRLDRLRTADLFGMVGGILVAVYQHLKNSWVRH